MIDFEILKSITIKTESKIILLVIDGLGGIAHPETGKTELETAKLPNLNSLCKKSLCGLHIPVSIGITPGSAPAHLALFGYDPVKYQIGRGILEALGLGMEVGKRDLSARANFATIENGIVTDRRAGRITTEKCKQLCTKLQNSIHKIDDIEVRIFPGKEHRFVVIFRGEGLSDQITENDPQKEKLQPKKIFALFSEAKKTVTIVTQFIDTATEILKDEPKANYVLVRGFSKYPEIPSMEEIYKLTPAAIATYPMYRGLAQLVKMKILPTGETIEDEIQTLEKEYKNYDFFYVHIKLPDALGEDGNFVGKVKKLEEIDTYLPRIINLKPDVLIITGDHSTPAVLKSHSWHPVPILLCSKYTQSDVERFTEIDFQKGPLGTFPAQDIMPLVLANALKLTKFGA